ncbi:hypothetical protein [Bacillus fonticola]|uniref:hypothetical protein n=1 Tax=Bacillus fonticola TaxID=2728853 RepID=UPI001475530E|nr:hypothetical protein [Bacillus fonticola]
MSQDDPVDIYEALKKMGFKLEQQMNELIQKQLDREDVIRQVNISGKLYGNMMKKLQDYTETLSVYLNFPTKKDVANTAKLVMQTEEKVDGLDEQLVRLTTSVDELKQWIPSKKLDEAGRDIQHFLLYREQQEPNEPGKVRLSSSFGQDTKIGKRQD